MNTQVDKDDNGKWIGIMEWEELLDSFSSYSVVKAWHAYGPRGHRGMSVLIFQATWRPSVSANILLITDQIGMLGIAAVCHPTLVVIASCMVTWLSDRTWNTLISIVKGHPSPHDGQTCNVTRRCCLYSCMVTWLSDRTWNTLISIVKGNPSPRDGQTCNVTRPCCLYSFTPAFISPLTLHPISKPKAIGKHLKEINDQLKKGQVIAEIKATKKKYNDKITRYVVQEWIENNKGAVEATTSTKEKPEARVLEGGSDNLDEMKQTPRKKKNSAVQAHDKDNHKNAGIGTSPMKKLKIGSTEADG